MTGVTTEEVKKSRKEREKEKPIKVNDLVVQVIRKEDVTD